MGCNTGKCKKIVLKNNIRCSYEYQMKNEIMNKAKKEKKFEVIFSENFFL